MSDMEFVNLIMSHDGDGPDEEEEVEDDPPEPQEPTVCCCCGRNIPVEEQIFDCEGCPHFTCVCCRFIDNVQCIFCKPESKSQSTAMQVETSSLKELYSMYFTRKKLNKDHIVDVELSTEEGSVQKQMCTICKRVFKKSNAGYHNSCATGEKPYACGECGLKFVKKSHLESHLNKHYGVRPFKCSEPKCGASFTQKDKLVRHMKSHKKGVKLMCPLCDKLYTSQDILNHHMVKVHSSTKQFKCDQCPRTYKYPSSLRIHRLKHQAKRDYMCEVCGKKYALSAQLKFHKRSHVLYHRRPFKCRCGRRFTSRRDKARHELIHTSCHDFECSLCNTTFGRKDNLERHMKNFHQENPPALKKTCKPIATIAPFNVKSAIVKQTDAIIAKQKCLKEKTNKVKKQKSVKVGEPKVKLKDVKEVNRTKSDIPKSVKKLKGKSNQTVNKTAFKTTDGTNPKVNVAERNSQQSVIVSPQQNVPQNRPSVIKAIPPLLPYRILPPDKRFLKLAGDLSKVNDHSQTSSNNIVNLSHSQTVTLQKQKDPLPIYGNYENPIDATLRIVDIPTPPQNVRRKIPRDDALNRCFRTIQHTNTVRVDHGSADNVPPETNKTLEGNLGVVMRSFDRKIVNLRSRKQQTRISSAFLTSPGYTSNKLNQEIRQISSNVMNFDKPVEMTNSSTNSDVGGPSLPASLSDSVSEINQEDNFTSSYTSMGEGTYPSYTPYFDNEYFRDSMNSYDSNVENLLPNDLDIGFQYINEELGCSEMTFSSESRIIRYVSQEKRIVRES